MKKLAILLPFFPIALCFCALVIFCSPSDFGVHKISSNFPFRPEWEVAGLDDAPLKEIFSQSFRYLNNGLQSYAFASEDGKYVIKFFNMEPLSPSRLGNIFPLEKYKEKNRLHAELLESTFAACKMAYEELKEETGLIYVHLNATDHLRKSLILFDKSNSRYVVDLDKTVFVVQKRAEMIYKRISHAIKAGDIEKAQRSVQAVLDLIARRNSKGFEDIDTNVSQNYGFVGDQPIHIDFLRIRKADQPNETERIAAKMHNWIESHYPGRLVFPEPAL